MWFLREKMSVLLWHLGVSGLCLDESHSLFVCIMWAHTHTNTNTVCVCVCLHLNYPRWNAHTSYHWAPFCRSPHKNVTDVKHAQSAGSTQPVRWVASTQDPVNEEFILSIMSVCCPWYTLNQSAEECNRRCDCVKHAAESYSRTHTENKSRHSTWVRVYSRCSAACSFCHICLWFQGRRSETQTGTMSQQEHFQQVGDGVSACSSMCAGVIRILELTQCKCAFTRPGIVWALHPKWNFCRQWLLFSAAAANWWDFGADTQYFHAIMATNIQSLPRADMVESSQKKLFCYNRPLFISFRLCSHLKEHFNVLSTKQFTDPRPPLLSSGFGSSHHSMKINFVLANL